MVFLIVLAHEEYCPFVECLPAEYADARCVTKSLHDAEEIKSALESKLLQITEEIHEIDTDCGSCTCVLDLDIVEVTDESLRERVSLEFQSDEEREILERYEKLGKQIFEDKNFKCDAARLHRLHIEYSVYYPRGIVNGL
jgi:hypothetical protein